jgi:hypothetical protein
VGREKVCLEFHGSGTGKFQDWTPRYSGNLTRFNSMNSVAQIKRLKTKMTNKNKKNAVRIYYDWNDFPKIFLFVLMSFSECDWRLYVNTVILKKRITQDSRLDAFLHIIRLQVVMKRLQAITRVQNSAVQYESDIKLSKAYFNHHNETKVVIQKNNLSLNTYNMNSSMFYVLMKASSSLFSSSVQ